MRAGMRGLRLGERQAQERGDVKTWTFEVPGPIVGHKCSKSQCFSPAVMAFKTDVRLKGNLAGVPQELDPKRRYSLCTVVYWVKKAQTDTDNVHKLTKDGLWGKDRCALKGDYDAVEFSGVERVVITAKDEGKRNVQGNASVHAG